MSRILVTNENLDAVFFELECHGVFSLDTETTGLNPYKGDRLFSVIVSTYKDDFYFNFNTNAAKEYILPRRVLRRFRPLLDNSDNVFYMHNAKFDMHMFHVEQIGISFKAKIICTQAHARLVHNQLPSYSLAALGQLIGHEKDDTVEKYISKHKLYTLVDVSKKKPRKDKHYDQVPFDIISNYGMQDGRVTFELGNYINVRLQELAKEQQDLGLPDLQQVVSNEEKLTKTLFRMEAKGIKIDRAYCQEAYEYEVGMYQEAAEKYFVYTDGIEFEDAASCFKKAFEKLGLEAGKTEKGNDSYSQDNLPDNELTSIILQYRKHYKRATTYFKNYLDLADENDVIHCNFAQAGTTTGRLSSYNPNLQNVPKRGEDDAKYPVRRAFIPREGCMFIMIDWDQVEYRLLLDVAGENETIDKILGGLDVHTATAEMMGVERDPAKTLNFMLLYGGGIDKLAAALKINRAHAKELKAKYFRTLRKVQGLITAIITVAKQRGFLVNWLGRRILTSRGSEYKMPNHYIQGGCGDVAKVAMNKMDTYIASKDIDMLLTVHDECIFELPLTHESDIPECLKEIMETSYPHKRLPLTAGIDYSNTDWHNKKKY